MDMVMKRGIYVDSDSTRPPVDTIIHISYRDTHVHVHKDPTTSHPIVKATTADHTNESSRQNTPPSLN